jgi:hypothetical protein
MITDEQIDAILGQSPFFVQQKMRGHGYEIVQNTSPEWRTHIPNDGWVHHGDFETLESAQIHAGRLHVRFILSSIPVSPPTSPTGSTTPADET